MKKVINVIISKRKILHVTESLFIKISNTLHIIKKIFFKKKQKGKKIGSYKMTEITSVRAELEGLWPQAQLGLGHRKESRSSRLLTCRQGPPGED